MSIIRYRPSSVRSSYSFKEVLSAMTNTKRARFLRKGWHWHYKSINKTLFAHFPHSFIFMLILTFIRPVLDNRIAPSCLFNLQFFRAYFCRYSLANSHNSFFCISFQAIIRRRCTTSTAALPPDHIEMAAVAVIGGCSAAPQLYYYCCAALF